jgi:transposase
MADVTTLLAVGNRLRQRFRIRRVCIVADRGMISEDTITALESDTVGCDWVTMEEKTLVKRH